MPRPGVTCSDNHTYFSMKQCIIDYLGQDNLPQRIPCKSTSTQVHWGKE